MIGREQLAELLVLAAVAQEHLLVIGPPGTGKSAVVRRVAQALGGRVTSNICSAGSPSRRSCSARWELDGKSLDVSLLERGASRRISLPAGDEHAVDLKRPPIISIDGTRVGVLHRDIPAVSSIYIPRSSREEPRLPRLQRWSYGYSPLSAMLLGKNLGILMGSSRQLRLWPTNMTLKPRPPQAQFHASASTDSWLPAAWLRGRQSHHVCVIDDHDRLLRWKPPS